MGFKAAEEIAVTPTGTKYRCQLRNNGTIYLHRNLRLEWGRFREIRGACVSRNRLSVLELVRVIFVNVVTKYGILTERPVTSFKVTF